MRAPEYSGRWVCLGCGARVRATAVLEDPLSYPPCPACMIGKMRVDRRSERKSVQRERRAARP